MDLPTYTNIWRIEKRLYKLYDLKLPTPLPIVWIGVFVGVLVPWWTFLLLVGLPFDAPWHVVYLVPPGIVTWLSTRPVIEGKRLTELLQSQVRYLAEPRTWCRMAPASEPEEITLTVRVWRSAPARKGRATGRQRRAAAPTVRPAVAAAAKGAAAVPAVAEPLPLPAAVAEPLPLPTASASASARATSAPAPASFGKGTADVGPGSTLLRNDGTPARSGRASSGADAGYGAPAVPRIGPDALRKLRRLAASAQDGSDRRRVAERAVGAPGLAEPGTPVRDERGAAPGGEEALRLPPKVWSSAEAPETAPATADGDAVAAPDSGTGAPLGHEGEAPATADAGTDAAAAAGYGSDAAATAAHRPDPVGVAHLEAEAAEMGPTAEVGAHDARATGEVATAAEAEGTTEVAARAADKAAEVQEAAEVAAAGADVTAPAEVPQPERLAHDRPRHARPDSTPEEARESAHEQPRHARPDWAPVNAGESAHEPLPHANAEATEEPLRHAKAETAEEPLRHANAEAAEEPGRIAPGRPDAVAAEPSHAQPAHPEPSHAQPQHAEPPPVPPSLAERPGRGAARPAAEAAHPAAGESGGTPPVRPLREVADATAASTEEPAREVVRPLSRVPLEETRPVHEPVAEAPRGGGAAGEHAGEAVRPVREPVHEPTGQPVQPADPPAVPVQPADPPAVPVQLADPPAVPVSIRAAAPGDEPRVRRVESVVGRDTSGGWRRIAQVVVGGGGGRTDGMEIDVARARTVLTGSRRILVLGCTGGAGQTTTTVMLGHTFAKYRDDRIVALDASAGEHTLTTRIPAESPETLSSLLAGSGGVSGYLGMRAYTSRCDSGLEVVGADSDAGAAQRLESGWPRMLAALDRHYRLIIVDPAAALAARLLPYADQLVLVAPASEDAPDAVAMTYEWLDGHGCSDLRRRAVMVVNGVSRRSASDVEQAEAVARGRCRAIVRIPWEDELSRQGPVDPARLRPGGRRAYVALAGVIASGLAANQHKQEVAR
ncbi:TcpE family conjugal transfer membrane protein [Microtetraspora fusca]|uniref:TcpE family conjugal transfer membrane protein n=1 Tax=Microtetraspora fusca TaxID=1997 RepID=A0ABW6V3R8_MICFU